MLPKGLDLNSLQDQFTAPKGRTLILDADSMAYAATATAKTLPTAGRRFVQNVLELMFLTECQFVRAHLTANTCAKVNRKLYPTVQPYQGNRKFKSKPPLLEPLRQALRSMSPAVSGLIPEGWSITVHDWLEADDAVVQDSFVLGVDGLVYSEDKDLALAPGPVYLRKKGIVDTLTDRLGWIDTYTTRAGAIKAFGHGTKFFWLQMLMGDQADNVKGLTKFEGKPIGFMRAFQFVQQYSDESALARAVLQAYSDNAQHPLPEAECLWLRRFDGDSAFNYLSSLDLEPGMQAWLVAQNEWCLAHTVTDEVEV